MGGSGSSAGIVTVLVRVAAVRVWEVGRVSSGSGGAEVRLVAALVGKDKEKGKIKQKNNKKNERKADGKPPQKEARC